MNLIEERGFKLCDIAVVDTGYRGRHLFPKVTSVLQLKQDESFPKHHRVAELSPSIPDRADPSSVQATPSSDLLPSGNVAPSAENGSGNGTNDMGNK